MVFRAIKRLKRLGFKENAADKCIFSVKIKGVLIHVAIFVDDGLIARSSLELIDKVLFSLSEEFDITIGDGSGYIGLQIERDNIDASVFIHQSKYVEEILKYFNISSAKRVRIPLDTNIIWQPVLEISDAVKRFPYLEAIGVLIFLAIVTHPDIAFAVNLLSRFISNFDENHVRAVKRVFAYLSGTVNLGIKYKSGGYELILSGYSNADFANDVETRRSSIEYVYCILANGPVTWLSKRQPIVTPNTTDSE